MGMEIGNLTEGMDARIGTTGAVNLNRFLNGLSLRPLRGFPGRFLASSAIANRHSLYRHILSSLILCISCFSLFTEEIEAKRCGQSTEKALRNQFEQRLKVYK